MHPYQCVTLDGTPELLRNAQRKVMALREKSRNSVRRLSSNPHRSKAIRREDRTRNAGGASPRFSDSSAVAARPNKFPPAENNPRQAAPLWPTLFGGARFHWKPVLGYSALKQAIRPRLILIRNWRRGGSHPVRVQPANLAAVTRSAG